MKITGTRTGLKKPLLIKGRNASGKIIEAYIPAGVLPRKDPGLAIAQSLKKYPNILPTLIQGVK